MTAGDSTPRSRRADGKPHRPRPAHEGEEGLKAPHVPRPKFQPRIGRYVMIAFALILLVSWFVWYASTPDKLPTTDRTVSANGVAGAPLYVGMFSAPDDFDRTLRVAGVKVHATTNTEMTVTPLLCRRGTVGVTSRPEQFCSELDNPEGQRLVGGDSIVLKIESTESAVAVIDQIRVAYREDIRWDTQPAGHQQAIVTLAGRPPAEPDTE